MNTEVKSISPKVWIGMDFSDSTDVEIGNEFYFGLESDVCFLDIKKVVR